MAAIGMMIGSAVVNAFTFSGGNALFALIDKSGSTEEMARHNRAIEDLQRAHEEWTQKCQARLDYLNDQLRLEAQADRAFTDANEAMRLYYDVTGGDKQKKLQGIPDVGNEPTLDDYYQLSEEQKKYELIFLAGGIGFSGWLAFKYL